MHYDLCARTQLLSRLAHYKHAAHVEYILAPRGCTTFQRIPRATKLHFMLVCGDQKKSFRKVFVQTVCRQNFGISPASDCSFSRVRAVLS